LSGELIRASLRRSGRDQGPLLNAITRPVELARVRSLTAKMTAVLNRANRWGDMDQGSWDLLRQHGQLLFDEVLPADLKTSLRETAGADLVLVLDEALVFVPWELMHTGRGFLGLEMAVGRIVRSEERVLGGPRPVPDGPWRMLILCDPRGDLMGSYYEGVMLRDELDDARGHLAIDMRSSEIGVEDAKRLVREYDILHYAGHAELHADRPDQSGWLLADGLLTPAAVIDLAGGAAFPRLVFSNACRSGQLAGPLISGPEAELTFSIANAFLLSGVRHYVGTLWDVPDEPACHFSLSFYASLVAGRSLGSALQDARSALRARYGEDTVLWASWVLYGDPSVPCFEARPVTEGSERLPSAMTPPPRDPEASTAPEPRAAVTRIRGSLAPAIGLAPPEEGAGLGTFLLRLGLGLLVAALTAWVVILAMPSRYDGSDGGAGIMPRETVSVRVPEVATAPRVGSFDPPPPAAPAPAPAPLPAAAPVADPELAVWVLRGDDPAKDAELLSGAELLLHSWEHFQVRLRAPDGYAAVWHVESQGKVTRLWPPETDRDPTAAVDGADWVSLPTEATWYYLDDRRGQEAFLLGHAQDPAAGAELLQRLKPVERALVRVRRARALRSEEMVLRGIGGEAQARGPGAAEEEAILASLFRLLEESYDRVIITEVRHQ
jgi:hypothetical protein